MEIIVFAIIALVVLGPKRLPEAGKALGESIRGFKTSMHEPTPPETLQASVTQPELATVTSQPEVTVQQHAVEGS